MIGALALAPLISRLIGLLLVAHGSCWWPLGAYVTETPTLALEDSAQRYVFLSKTRQKQPRLVSVMSIPHTRHGGVFLLSLPVAFGNSGKEHYHCQLPLPVLVGHCHCKLQPPVLAGRCHCQLSLPLLVGHCHCHLPPRVLARRCHYQLLLSVSSLCWRSARP